MFKPRPAQAAVLRYRGGKMGVAAVPGSGKTHTLSALAADLVAGGTLQDGQEVLIVTLVNSAVNNFSRRVGAFVEERGLLPNLGYRVRTLHGLAHDIVRERPALAGLESQFQIVDERAALEILSGAAREWVNNHPEIRSQLLSSDGQANRKVVYTSWPDLIRDLAAAFISTAKDLESSPGNIRAALDTTEIPLPLVEMGWEIYRDYQRGLSYRGAVDFNDLIRLCLQALRADEEYLARLRWRWPYILEDEAQDSSELQEKILRMLSGPDGNWVRVGDTNQAIFETFTTASPRFLRNFLVEPGVTALDLPDSGRSQAGIIKLANALVDWACSEHPDPAGRQALTPIHIQPAPPGDPQPNPPEDHSKIFIYMEALTADEELALILKSLKTWLPLNPKRTVAVLVSTNKRGADLADMLKNEAIPYVELLRSTHSTREAARALEKILASLADPAQPGPVRAAYEAWRGFTGANVDPQVIEKTSLQLKKCVLLENFVHPRLEKDWLGDEMRADLEPAVLEELRSFQTILQRWHAASILPVGQLVLTIAQDLFHEPADLATAGRLSTVMDTAARDHPDWGLAAFAGELGEIAANRRKFAGLSEEENGFDPEKHQGKVIVSTVHKAKGLEFDRVYIISVNNYDFPSGLPQDQFISEKWFIEGQLNLEAEALFQLRAILKGTKVDLYETGRAGLEARQDYIAERLRLLYVGITRARRELVITWNTGRQKNLSPALPLKALSAYWMEVTRDSRG